MDWTWIDYVNYSLNVLINAFILIVHTACLQWMQRYPNAMMCVHRLMLC